MNINVKPRKIVLELGLLPFGIILPKVDSFAALEDLHVKLAADSSQGFVTAAKVAEHLDLPLQSIQLLAETLNAIQPQKEEVLVEDLFSPLPLHNLLLLLFVQLYAREAHRPDTKDHWPDQASQASPMADCFSPTRSGARSPLSGQSPSKALLRAQVQQVQQKSQQTMKAYSEFLKRHIKKLVYLVLDQPSYIQRSSSLASQPSLSDAFDTAMPDTPMANAELVYISRSEVERLLLLLEPKRMQITPLGQAIPIHEPGQAAMDALSTCTNLFAADQTVQLDLVMHWLKHHWMEEVQDPSPLPALSNGLSSMPSMLINTHRSAVGAVVGRIDDSRVSGVCKGTVVKGEADVPTGHLSVCDCHEAVIYVLAPLKTVLVSGCSECTVVVGATGRMLRVEKCEKVTLIACCASIVIWSCHDCVFHLGVNRPPYLMGDNRFLTLAPFNTRYEGQPNHLRQVGMTFGVEGSNKWDQPIVVGASTRRQTNPGSPHAHPLSSSGSPCTAGRPPVTLMPPQDMLPFVVPFKGTLGPLAGGAACPESTKWSHNAEKPSPLPPIPFPLPRDYQLALQAKFDIVHDLRVKVKHTLHEEARRRELQGVIQAYFREWLNSTNQFRQVHDLYKLEPEDVNPQVSHPQGTP